MTSESYYRRAAFPPVVLPLATAAVVTLTVIVPLLTPVGVVVDDAAGFLAIAGMVGVLPYALWAVVAMAWTEPKSEADYRRLSRYAPVSIAFPFGVLMGLLALRDGVIGGVIRSFST